MIEADKLLSGGDSLSHYGAVKQLRAVAIPGWQLSGDHSVPQLRPLSRVELDISELVERYGAATTILAWDGPSSAASLQRPRNQHGTHRSTAIGQISRVVRTYARTRTPRNRQHANAIIVHRCRVLRLALRRCKMVSNLALSGCRSSLGGLTAPSVQP
jgi:hypothetical protein